MKQRILSLIEKKYFLLLIYILLAVIAAVQSYSHDKAPMVDGGISYNRYNNYVIFKSSFEHLTQNQNLYIEYPEQHWDLYKYTPTFSLFFGLFYYLPDLAGLIAWDLLNALVLLVSIYCLPNLSNRKKGIMLLILTIELMTSLQNQQSNGLIAGLLVLSFAMMEKKNYALTAFAIMATAYIKLFGIIALIMFLFYPQKWKSALYSLLWFAVLFVLPLAVIPFGDYTTQIHNYTVMLNMDKAISYGFSVLGVLHTWFHLNPDKNLVLFAGFVLLSIPFIRVIYSHIAAKSTNTSSPALQNQTDFYYRSITFAALLIWLVIFNHKAESPTFIIAFAGIALWIVSGKASTTDTVLFILSLLFTSLSTTDLFPKVWRTGFFVPYYIKAIPCILIYFYLTYKLLSRKLNVPEIIDIEVNERVISRR